MQSNFALCAHLPPDSDAVYVLLRHVDTAVSGGDVHRDD